MEGDVDGEDDEEEEGRANKRGQRTERYCKDFTYAFQVLCVAFIVNIGYILLWLGKKN